MTSALRAHWIVIYHTAALLTQPTSLISLLLVIFDSSVISLPVLLRQRALSIYRELLLSGNISDKHPYRAVQGIRNQGGGSPPLLAIFQNWGGEGGEFFSKIISFIIYMTHFGLIKLESSNLLDITNSVTINIPYYI